MPVLAEAEHFDFAIFGSGFAGSIMAMVLRKLGYSVLLLERGSHPRFAIGESSTPFANLLLEHLAREYDLPFLRHFSEWGLWQQSHPDVAAGLKRGFTFYHHTTGAPLDLEDRSRQLLVGASPNDRVADTHWYRPDFDSFLVDRAVELGVQFRDLANIDRCELCDGDWLISSQSRSGPFAAKTRFVIDASGPNGFLTQLLSIPSTRFSAMPATHSAYAHFQNVNRFAPALNSLPPYPPDDAALHHVFEDGWIWVLRFNNGITSAGASLQTRKPGPHFPPDQIWANLIARFPSVADQFRDSIPTTPFYSIPQISFRRNQIVGPNWLLLPSAAGFVDPLLSTGFALTLLGIMRLGMILKRSPTPSARDLSDYQCHTLAELDAAADLVGALYAKMHSFDQFTRLTLLYFAAMSFTETVWRLGQSKRASGFLLTNDLKFSESRRRICEQARLGAEIHDQEIASVIEPYNIAGLLNSSRRNWYPADFNDLKANRAKLGCTDSELESLRLLAAR